jgi:hypothetical protein
MICEEGLYMKDFPHCEFVTKFLKGTSQMVQQQHLVAKNHVPPQGGNVGHSYHEHTSTSASKVYMFKTVNVITRENTYDTPLGDHANGNTINQPSTSTPPPSSNPLNIENPISDLVLRSPKSAIRKATFNPNACATQNYNIIEDLTQAPFAMSALEVLQHFPSRRRTLLSIIGAMDPKESNPITFNLDYSMERLSHHLAFQIQIFVGGKNIHHNVLDEGTSTYVMSFSCWRALGSPKLGRSSTTLKVFDGCGFQPHRLLQSIIVTLKGKIVSVDIEVVDAPLDYNLLLGRSWFYAITAVTSLVFPILRFPHQGKIITVDQLDYTTPSLHNVASNNFPFLGHNSFESVGVGLLKDSLLMGIFPLCAPPTP